MFKLKNNNILIILKYIKKNNTTFYRLEVNMNCFQKLLINLSVFLIIFMYQNKAKTL
jgi:hypothetical protein